jgi:hypothetical protein
VAAGFGFGVQNGGIERLFAGEMAENDGLGDARGGGDLLGGSAAEAFAGEQFQGCVQQLAPAVAGIHAGGGVSGFMHAPL